MPATKAQKRVALAAAARRKFEASSHPDKEENVESESEESFASHDVPMDSEDEAEDDFIEEADAVKLKALNEIEVLFSKHNDDVYQTQKRVKSSIANSQRIRSETAARHARAETQIAKEKRKQSGGSDIRKFFQPSVPLDDEDSESTNNSVAPSPSVTGIGIIQRDDSDDEHDVYPSTDDEDASVSNSAYFDAHRKTYSDQAEHVFNRALKSLDAVLLAWEKQNDSTVLKKVKKSYTVRVFLERLCQQSDSLVVSSIKIAAMVVKLVLPTKKKPNPGEQS